MSLEIIKQLRADTGAGMVDVKKALDEAGGDVEKAKEILRKQGAKIAAKKQDRDVSEGLIHTYIHPPGKIGAMVKLACETDFVARNEDFKALAHSVAKQIAAMTPLYVKPEEVPAEELEKEKAIHREMLEKEGKPADMMDKIIDGKLNKYYEQVCLLEQPYILDDSQKIKDIITEATAKLGERIEVIEFTRYEL